MITLIIADDDTIIREGLKLMISTCDDLSVLGICKDGKEALDMCRELHPDVALLDIRMPNMDGIEASKRILQEELAQPLLLTTFDEEEFILQALQIGVAGYILKNSPAERIMNAIRAVAAGAVVFQQDILECIQGHVESEKEDNFFTNLSNREMEVVKLIAEGYSNQEIADRLFLSNGTVRNHVSLILEKTGLEHRTQIAVRYLKGKDE